MSHIKIKASLIPIDILKCSHGADVGHFFMLYVPVTSAVFSKIVEVKKKATTSEG